MDVRQRLRTLFVCLATDDEGQDLVEYALLIGVVAVGAALAVPTASALGTIYNNWVDRAYDLWEAPAPSAGSG
jgi:Flp pilus assembly pilin Flp